MQLCRKVPISTYEELQPLIERTRTESKMFFGHSHKMVCQICGTTNAKSKFIPVSNEALGDCTTKAARICVCI
jgi:hypothetical protein